MRPHPRRAATDPGAPEAWATDDRSGFVGNHRNLCWQYEWAGQGLVNKRIAVYEDMLDEPQRQLGSIILPPDPVSVQDALPEQYDIEEEPVSTRVTMDGRVRIVQPVGALPSMRIISVRGNL